jgi:hypothetical protein
MHGLVNHALERFLRDTRGAAFWEAVVRDAGAEDRFEPLLPYPPAMTGRIVRAAADRLTRPPDMVLEDLGIWLVVGGADGRLRRLLRFCAADFAGFVASLEDLPARARLALPELDLPALRVADRGHGRFHLRIREPFDGARHVLAGVLRAMADDYGALVLIETGPRDLFLHLLDAAHGQARRFDLAGAGA